jgi:colanic acid biosynthesis glycosyl transferase WcaI
MHILLLTTYFEPDSGAAAVRLSRLARLLQQAGHTVTVLTTLPHYPEGRIHKGYRWRWQRTETRDGVTVIQVWLWATPSPKISRKLLSQMSFMFTAALRGLSLPKPDVILVEGQPVFTALAGRFLSRAKSAPYVLNISDLWPDHLLTVGTMSERSLIYRVARRVVNGLYRGAAAIASMSPQWTTRIEQHIGQHPALATIYNGVDLTRFQPGLDDRAFREKYQLGDARIISFIGMFTTQYDFAVMFAVARRLAHRHDLRFVFIGDGSQAEQVRAEVANSPNTRWLGVLPAEEIPQAWAASSLSYWSVRREDLYRGIIPAKLYEALASGVPVVSGLEGAAADLITQSGGGINAPFANADALVEGILQLLDDPARYAACQQAARAFAEAHLQPEAVAAAYADLLQTAIDSRR